MVVVFWLFVLLVLGLCAGGVYHFRRQQLRIRKLKHALLAVHRKTHREEETHSEMKIQWQQTEEKLRGYLQLMDTLMNTISNPIYFKDDQGVYQGCNKVFATHILGLTRDRIIGKRSHELPRQIPADLASTYQREERRMIHKRGFHTYETKVQCADGQRRDFLFSLAPIVDENGDPTGSVTVLSDLTEKNRAARNLMHKEKLEAVLETAGAVCHELNQPLQALSGYAELMAMRLDGHDAVAHVDALNAQIDRMRQITDKLQGITRYETTDYAGNTKIIDIHKASQIDGEHSISNVRLKDGGHSKNLVSLFDKKDHGQANTHPCPFGGADACRCTKTASTI